MSHRYRFWTLLALRWLPTGFLVPVFALLPLDRGLSIAQFSIASAISGVFVLLFELPTGGFADTIGRKPVYIASAIVALLSFSIFATATTFTGFLIAAAFQGIYRALDSGPLSAWFVDRVDDPRDVANGLSRGAAITSIAIALGALISGGLIVINPFEGINDLALPVWAAFTAVVIHVIAMLILMDEDIESDLKAALHSMRNVVATVREGFALVRTSHVLTAMIIVEVLWAWGMVSFETFTPIRLGELLGGLTAAGAVMGPTTTAAWALSGLAALLVPSLLRRYSKISLSIALKIIQSLGLIAMAVAGVPVWFIAAFLLTYVVHVPAGAVWEAIVHENVDNRHRATALSLASMGLQVSGGAGLIALGFIADHTATQWVFVVGAVSLFLAAPLFLIKNRHP